jgi:hypothetical protein
MKKGITACSGRIVMVRCVRRAAMGLGIGREG